MYKRIFNYNIRLRRRCLYSSQIRHFNEKTKVAVPHCLMPCFVAFGLAGFWSCRHRILYKTQREGKQTTLSASIERTTHPSPQRVAAMTLLFALCGHVIWLRTLRSTYHCWPEILRITQNPAKSGLKLGLQTVNLSYFYSAMACFAFQIYADVNYPEQRKIDPSKNPLAESVAHVVIHSSRIWLAIFTTTCIFSYSTGICGGMVFTAINRSYWIRQMNKLPHPVQISLGLK